MTKIISAFPCLGKTTLTNKYKNNFFDAEIYESRATKGMSKYSIARYFKNSAKNIKLIHDTGTYDVIFVTDDDRLLNQLRKLGLKIIHVLPNPYNGQHLNEYIQRVIARSGLEWYNRVLAEDIKYLQLKVSSLTFTDEEIYVVEPGKYIEHLVPNLVYHV